MRKELFDITPEEPGIHEFEKECYRSYLREHLREHPEVIERDTQESWFPIFLAGSLLWITVGIMLINMLS